MVETSSGEVTLVVSEHVTLPVPNDTMNCDALFHARFLQNHAYGIYNCAIKEVKSPRIYCR